MSSPLLGLPGAAPLAGDAAGTTQHLDDGIAWHYGDPMGEQRAAETGSALLDLSTRDVLAVTGADRLTWLNALTSQDTTGLTDGDVTQALILSPTGHVEHQMVLTVIGGTVFLDTEPGHGDRLQTYLDSMRFWSKVQVETRALGLLRMTGSNAAGHLAGLVAGDRAAAYAEGFSRPAAGVPGGLDVAVPAGELGAVAASLIGAGVRPAGSWAATALRIAAREPRLGVDTDDRTIPNELPWLTSAVHLDKGCYRGQETVARVHNLGRPPRRLVLLNLDGSVERLPRTGSAVTTVGTAGAAGRTVGRVGAVAHHHELGAVALALVKRGLPADTPLLADGIDALIDPDDATIDESAPRSAVDRQRLPDLRRR